jgi:hypothetical protein
VRHGGYYRIVARAVLDVMEIRERGDMMDGLAEKDSA